jgi:hypothetical protein
MRGRVSARWLRARVSPVLLDLSLALRSRPSTTPHHHVHRRPLLPLSSEVTCNSAAPDTNPFPRRVSNRGGALLKKCAVSPPFPHAVPQVISRKLLDHFRRRPTWRLAFPFLCFACSVSSADGLLLVRAVRSSWAPYWSGTSLPTPTIAGGSPSQARRSQWSNFARYASSQIRMSSR